MAEATVLFLIKQIASVLVTQGFSSLSQAVSQVQQVEAKLRAIEDELRVMSGFLRDVDRRGEHSSDSALKVWVQTVREVAHEAEDIIEEISYLVGKPQRGGPLAFLGKVNVKPWVNVSHDLQNIETRLKQLSETRDRGRCFKDVSC